VIGSKPCKTGITGLKLDRIEYGDISRTTLLVFTQELALNTVHTLKPYVLRSMALHTRGTVQSQIPLVKALRIKYSSQLYLPLSQIEVSYANWPIELPLSAS